MEMKWDGGGIWEEDKILDQAEPCELQGVSVLF